MEPSAQAWAEALSIALSKLPPYDGAVFRGARLSVEKFRLYVPGGFRGEPGFTSATANPSITFSGDVQLQIFSRSGKGVSQFSSSPQEREVVFDRGRCSTSDGTGSTQSWESISSNLPT